MTDTEFNELKLKYQNEGITMVEVALVFVELEIAIKELAEIRRITAGRNRDGHSTVDSRDHKSATTEEKRG